MRSVHTYKITKPEGENSGHLYLPIPMNLRIDTEFGGII